MKEPSRWRGGPTVDTEKHIQASPTYLLPGGENEQQEEDEVQTGPNVLGHREWHQPGGMVHVWTAI